MGVEWSIIAGKFPELDEECIPGGGTYLDRGPDLEAVGVIVEGGFGGPELGKRNNPG